VIKFFDRSNNKKRNKLYFKVYKNKTKTKFTVPDRIIIGMGITGNLLLAK